MTFKTIVLSMKNLQRPLIADPEMAHLPFPGITSGILNPLISPVKVGPHLAE